MRSKDKIYPVEGNLNTKLYNMLCLRNNYFSLKFHQLLVSKSKFFLLLPQYNFNQHLFSILRNNKIYFFFTHSRFVISTKLGFLKGSYC